MKPILCESYAPAVKGSARRECTHRADDAHSGLPSSSHTVDVMTVEQQEVWGAPAAKAPAWSTRTTLLAAAIAAVLAVGTGVVVYATWDSAGDSSAHNSAPPGFGGPGGPGSPGDTERTLHSASVVADGKGGFHTELTQTGSITAASDASITVRSADGYSHTYRLGADTRKPRQPLQNGQQVTVRATETNGTDDATAVLPAR